MISNHSKVFNWTQKKIKITYSCCCCFWTVFVASWIMMSSSSSIKKIYNRDAAVSCSCSLSLSYNLLIDENVKHTHTHIHFLFNSNPYHHPDHQLPCGGIGIFISSTKKPPWPKKRRNLFIVVIKNKQTRNIKQKQQEKNQ